MIASKSPGVTFCGVGPMTLAAVSVPVTVPPVAGQVGVRGRSVAHGGHRVGQELISELGHLHPKLLAVKGLSPSPVDNSNLDYRLEVTVRRAGTKVAITAQLIQVQDQTVKWGDSYERELKGPEDMIPIEI